MRISDFTDEVHAPDRSEYAPPSDEHFEPDADEEAASGFFMPALLLGLLVWLTVSVGWGALAVVLGFIFMIFMHELGHYLTAKAAGMKVTQFFLGFGPRLWSFRHGETEYGLKAIPLGAYVRIIGMNNLDPVEAGEEDRAYRSSPYWRRMSVVLAGSAMHFMMAFVALFLLHSVVGWAGPTEPEPWNIEQVLEDTPAEAMGMQAGDEVVSVAGFEVDSFSAMVGIIADSGDQLVEFVVDRNGTPVELAGVLSTQVNQDGEVVGFLGVRRGTVTPARQGPIDALETSGADFAEFTVESIKGIATLPQFLAEKLGIVSDQSNVGTGTGGGGGGDDSQVLGPIGMVRVGDEIVDRLGWRTLGALFVAVNIFVGFFNLVPLLPFDGGHAVIATYERLRSVGGRRHSADVGKLLPLTYATLAVLGMLMVITVYSDIFDFQLFS